MSSTNLAQVLADLKAAEFPRDYPVFYPYVHLLRKTDKGQRVNDRWHRSFKNQDCPQQIFLALLQSELLQASDRLLNELRGRLRSRKRDQLAREPVPARAARLRAEIEAEERQARDWVISQLDGTALMKRFMAALMNPSQPTPPNIKLQSRVDRKLQAKNRRRRAQKQQDEKPLKPTVRSWSTPMSVRDYCGATGMQRSAVEDFLRKKLKAREINPDRKPTEPKLYSVDVNLEVLAQWIGHWVRNLDQAGALAAATLEYARAHDAGFLNRIIHTFGQVLHGRGVNVDQLVADIKEHRELYSPKLDPFSEIMGLSRAPVDNLTL